MNHHTPPDAASVNRADGGTPPPAGSEGAKSSLDAKILAQLSLIAKGFLARERSNHTLEPDALVNEAWIRLSSSIGLQEMSRTDLVAAVVTNFRRILVDHARRRHASKRQGGHRVTLSVVEAEADSAPGEVDLLALHEAMEEFEHLYPRPHRVIELRWFGQFCVKDIAELLEISERTVANDSDFAKAWLRARMKSGG